MSYYDKLNEAIKNSLSDKDLQYQLLYFDEIVKLAIMIINNTPRLEFKGYTTDVSLNASIDNVIRFLNTIKPEYAYMLENILREVGTYRGKDDYSVRFYRVLDNKANDSYVRTDGFVHIDYSNTLDDTFTIAHEITHKFSQPKNQDSTIKEFLGETSTISMEFLLEDYLLKNADYDNHEVLIRKNNRLATTYDDALALLFENILLKLYKQNNNCITKEILLNYLNSMDKNSRIYELFLERGERYLNDIVNKGCLQFYKRQRYVIGVVLASYFHNKIKNDKEMINVLCYLIDILGHTDFLAEEDLRILSNLDIPIVKHGNLSISEDDIITLIDCYRNEVSDVMAYQNKNSRKA